MTRRGNVLDLAEAKDQERLHRQDHKHDKPDQEIGAPVWPYLMAKSAATVARANALNRRDTMWPAFAQSCLPEFVAIEAITEGGVLCGKSRS